MSTTTSSGCAKCGTSKTGKRSCCARGGAWFKNCGDIGDKKFEHTWAEGVQACKSFRDSVSVQSSVEFMIHPMGVADTQLNDSHVQHVVRQKRAKNERSGGGGGVTDAGATNYGDCVRYAKFGVGVMFIILDFHTWWY